MAALMYGRHAFIGLALAPESLAWFVKLDYDPSGYVKDDEKIDPGALLSSVRAGTEESNKERRRRRWETLAVVGWKYQS